VLWRRKNLGKYVSSLFCTRYASYIFHLLVNIVVTVYVIYLIALLSFDALSFLSFSSSSVLFLFPLFSFFFVGCCVDVDSQKWRVGTSVRPIEKEERGRVAANI
jgi:hypothetical protein